MQERSFWVMIKAIVLAERSESDRNIMQERSSWVIIKAIVAVEKSESDRI